MRASDAESALTPCFVVRTYAQFRYEARTITILAANSNQRTQYNRMALAVDVSTQLEIPVPDDVTKRKTTLELDPAGDWMHLSFKNRPDFEPLEGKFKDLISPLDSVWMLGEPAFS